ncbi:MAG: type II secretion system F family protein [Nanoarchaeota archaeon]|nr:type II secretion system F family protein [Nanoarchaeota archaeon]
MKLKRIFNIKKLIRIFNIKKDKEKSKHVSEELKDHEETKKIKVKKQKEIKKTKRRLVINIILALILGVIIFFYTKNAITSLVSIASIFILLQLSLFIKAKLKVDAEIKKMESVFPDFLQLMSSNLRAGITIDRALLMSSRKEFAPLDKEILKLGKEIFTGTEISHALSNMSKKINSEKIHKTINLIISGIRSGGNLAILLEETAVSMRERNFVEKRAASNVLMYVIFIFFAVSVGAPILFGFSSVLVQILTNLLSNLPPIETSGNVGLPFTLTKVGVSVTFVTYFSLVFLITMDILGSLILGLVSKGEEKAGIKFILPLIAISVSIFLASRFILLSYFSSGILG